MPMTCLYPDCARMCGRRCPHTAEIERANGLHVRRWTLAIEPWAAAVCRWLRRQLHYRRSRTRSERMMAAQAQFHQGRHP